MTNNPWHTIPLSDYEGHMASDGVGQGQMLVNELRELLREYTPGSLAVIGCAGGNGFDEAAKAGVRRLVGIDINAQYIHDAGNRLAHKVQGLELHCADIAGELPRVKPVELVYAALVFEYVELVPTLRNIKSLCQPEGVLAALLQLPKDGASPVSPSPYASLERLSSVMNLVPPQVLSVTAVDIGFHFLSQKLITLPSGKQFLLLLFLASRDT